MQGRILTINGGSSTIKFAVFRSQSDPVRILSGDVDEVSAPTAHLRASDDADGAFRAEIRGGDHREAAHSLLNWLSEWMGEEHFAAIGHRVVHGGTTLDAHQVITPEIVEELRRTQPLDLAHLPLEIALIEAFRDHLPNVTQIACFDTVFNLKLPRIAQMLPVPHRYFDSGVRRFGFHGLSYMYLMEELRLIDEGAAEGRVILAHLGSGASMTALKGGAPVDTTMAFTPTAGLVMGTRPGDIDPGLLIHIMRTEGLTPDQMDEFVSYSCGLKGVSGSSSDMRQLMARQSSDPRAKDAIDLFCYQARKWIGAYTAALGGLDTLVFSGGIGHRSPEIRATICDGLEYLGVALSLDHNARSTAVISRPESRVTVRVMRTDEELMIARIVASLIE